LNYLIILVIQYFWSKLDDLSFLTILTLVSMNVPGVAQIIQFVLINFIYFDILYTERWFPEFMTYLNLEIDFEDYPLNSYFNENGFESLTFLINIGSSFFFFIIYILLWTSLLLLKILTCMTTWFEKFRIKMQSYLMWNGSINLLMSQFTPIMMSSILNLYDL
jgi:hypothetical protein